MLKSSRAVVVILAGAMAVSARAGIAVTSFDTQAQANAYAPSTSVYYTDNSKHNISPAIGDVSDDWSGTNVGGTDTTWHMTALVHTASITTISTNALTITGSGSFSYEIATSSGFSEPLQHGSFFTPVANSSVGSIFSIDQAATYSLSATINGVSGISFGSFTDGFLLNQTHLGTSAKLIAMSGIIPPGKYQIGVGTGQHGPSGLPDGINDVLQSGSFDSFSFSVTIPEPSSWLAAALPIAAALPWSLRHGRGTKSRD